MSSISIKSVYSKCFIDYVGVPIAKVIITVIEWFFTLCYLVAMHSKMRFSFTLLLMLSSTGIKKEEDKWEYAYFYLFFLQLILLTIHYHSSWPSLLWTLSPLISVASIICIFLTILFIGLFRTTVKEVIHKRYMTGTAIIGILSLLLFLIHTTEKYGGKKDHSLMLLCIEFLIPEVKIIKRYSL